MRDGRLCPQQAVLPSVGQSCLAPVREPGSGMREVCMVKQVSPGSRWLYGERVVEVDGPISSHQLQVRDLGTGRLFSTSMRDLQPLPTSGREIAPLEVTQTEWERALPIAQAFAPYENLAYLPKGIAEAIAKQTGLSVRQI